jgi:ABC-type phosphate transport system ATPase subunit
LRTIGGLGIRCGRIVIGDRDVTELRAQANIGCCFQLRGVYLTVFDNVAFGASAETSLSDIRSRVDHAAALLRSNFRATEARLSRRRAPGALVMQPSVLLMDDAFEPGHCCGCSFARAEELVRSQTTRCTSHLISSKRWSRQSHQVMRDGALMQVDEADGGVRPSATSSAVLSAVRR